ncbi:amidohydrolase [Alphaproteobacteria bacterium]|nr:amidohydrolase [bacterium]MDC0147365.1 amidohydrolase [Alphaproteobacteria bacterium]
MNKIYHAKSIITMNPNQPRATHMAVRDGHILAVGQAHHIADWTRAWGDMPVDESFADKVFLPGFVEGHSHMMEGLFWNYAYVGYYDRQGPDGSISPGLKSIDAVVERLRALDAARDDQTEPLIAWGFDPIFFEGRRMSTDDLDQVSTNCPIIVLHASLHILNTNSLVMEQAGVQPGDNNEAVRRDENGKPSGEFLGQLGMYMAMRTTGLDLLGAAGSAQTLINFANVARQTGVTTATDLANPVAPEALETMRQTVSEASYPMRLVVAFQGSGADPETGIARLQELKGQQTDKLRFSMVKLVADGSIQGFSARLKWPGYVNGAENGLWYIEPDRLKALVAAYNAAGIQIHIHTNGDECTDVALDAIEAALREAPWADHRHTLQHCQMANRAQFKRMAKLGVGVNLFSNHLYYWGDAHISTTMGPERAARLDDAGGALAENVALAIHSDAPVTALAPLFTAWCAVHRLSSNGVTMGGDAEKLSVEQALHAITLGAAYSLRMDDEIGSLEVGKRADVAILARDPLAVESLELKDIDVHGTMVGGKLHLNQRPS